VATACLASTVLAGCGSIAMPGLPGLSVPDNDPAFRTRVYAGAALGTTRLDPDTGGTVYEVEGGSAPATQLRLGVDLHNLLAVEIESAVLGSAGLREADVEVDYSVASVSALVYAGGGVRMRSLREGWTAYARLGIGALSRSSRVVPLEGSGTGPVLGLGAEYGFDNGLGIRGELTRYDDDAVYTGLGVVYRFGVTPREALGLLGDTVRPVLDRPDTHVGKTGRAASTMRDEPALGAAVPRHEMQAGPPVRGLAATQPTADDADADGALDRQDLCPGTLAGVSVDRQGCGLFDAVLGDVMFKSGSWWLNARARGALDEFADTLLAFPEVRVEILAHTDDRGATDLNLELATRRAEAVLAYLRSRGLPEMQLQGTGVGESRPLVGNDSEAGRRSNRRIEVVTLPDLPAEVLAGHVPPGSVRHYPLVREALDVLARDDRPATTPTTAPPRTPGTPGPETDPALPSLAAALAGPDAARPIVPPVVPPAIAARLPLPAPGHVAGARMNGVVDGLAFDSGSDQLSADSATAMDTLVDTLQRYPNTRIAVMAHTGGDGRADDNLALSESRARHIVALLVDRGIEASRLEAEGYGDTLPRVQNLSEADRVANRRIEIRVQQ